MRLKEVGCRKGRFLFPQVHFRNVRNSIVRKWYTRMINVTIPFNCTSKKNSRSTELWKKFTFAYKLHNTHTYLILTRVAIRVLHFHRFLNEPQTDYGTLLEARYLLGKWMIFWRFDSKLFLRFSPLLYIKFIVPFHTPKWVRLTWKTIKFYRYWLYVIILSMLSHNRVKMVLRGVSVPKWNSSK